MYTRSLPICLVLFISHSALAGTVSLTDRATSLVFIGDVSCANTSNTGTQDFEVFDVTRQGNCAGFDSGDPYSGDYYASHYSAKTLSSEIQINIQTNVYLEFDASGHDFNRSAQRSFTVISTSRFDFTVDEQSAGQVEFAQIEKFVNYPNATLEADGVEIYNSYFAETLERIVFSPGVDYSWTVNGSVVLATVSNDVSNVGVQTRLKIEEDADLLSDFEDNCIAVDNADQRDTDADGFGNICDADLNNDCVVNFVDASIFSGQYLGSDPDADFNGDGFVNFLDLNILGSYFLLPPGESGVPNICSG